MVGVNLEPADKTALNGSDKEEGKGLRKMFNLKDIIESEGLLYVVSFLVVAAIFVLYFI